MWQRHGERCERGAGREQAREHLSHKTCLKVCARDEAAKRPPRPILPRNYPHFLRIGRYIAPHETIRVRGTPTGFRQAAWRSIETETMASVSRSKTVRCLGLPAVVLVLLACFSWLSFGLAQTSVARANKADNAPAVEHRMLARQSSIERASRTRRGHAAFASQSQTYLQFAEAGVKHAEQLWWNRRLGWYDSRLHDGERYPLATIWDSTPLFEALDAIDIAAPSPAHRAAVEAFAKGAERYWDAGLRPCPGFAPYLGDRGKTTAWFDDNGWWGLAFLDAYRATGMSRYLREAQRAFAFIAKAGWNSDGGGLWWNTAHPYIAGEPLAAGSLLGAQLLKLTGKQYYRTEVLKFLDWAESDFLTERHLYKRTESDPTPRPTSRGRSWRPIRCSAK